MNKAVITGYGVVGAFGYGKTALIDALFSAQETITPITLFDTQGCRCHIAGTVPGLDQTCIDRGGNMIDRALAEALLHAGLTEQITDSHVQVYQGTAHGALDRWYRQLHQPQADFPIHIADVSWRRLSANCQLRTFTSACVASSLAAGAALQAIRFGQTELALIAGVELLSPFVFRGFESLRLLTTSECRPFDQHRNGLVLGEGAAVLVLESESHAQKRGADILAELAGFACSSDANHMTAPDISGKGTALSLELALADANAPAEIDYINLHGTGTLHNDRMEINALKRVFGLHARSIALSSTKSMTGHTSGATGAIELAICVASLAQNRLPATRGLKIPDENGSHFNFITDQPLAKSCQTVISMNSGFGGNNAALIVRRYA